MSEALLRLVSMCKASGRIDVSINRHQYIKAMPVGAYG